MTLAEAIRSGKRFRRRQDSPFGPMSWEPAGFPESSYYGRPAILADDWEVEPEPPKVNPADVQILRDLEQAIKKALRIDAPTEYQIGGPELPKPREWTVCQTALEATRRDDWPTRSHKKIRVREVVE